MPRRSFKFSRDISKGQGRHGDLVPVKCVVRWQKYLMEAFMSINMEARQKGIQFNDKETALLVTILSSGMAPAEKKKLDMLKMMSKKLAGPR